MSESLSLHLTLSFSSLIDLIQWIKTYQQTNSADLQYNVRMYRYMAAELNTC